MLEPEQGQRPLDADELTFPPARGLIATHAHIGGERVEIVDVQKLAASASQVLALIRAGFELTPETGAVQRLAAVLYRRRSDGKR